MEIIYNKDNKTYLIHNGKIISFAIGDKTEDKETIEQWQKVIDRREKRLSEIA